MALTVDWVAVGAGAIAGFVVGMTGLGGGAVMTPMLLLGFGIAPLKAVGTDLWFAALTKVSVSIWHLRAGLIDWPVVVRLWLGSLPAALLTVAWLASRPVDPGMVVLFRTVISLAVCASAASLLLQSRLRAEASRYLLLEAPRDVPTLGNRQTGATVIAGMVLGMLVASTSVGAGALGVVYLSRSYPGRFTPVRLVATDIAHAIPLALCAGIGHLTITPLDWGLLRDLVLGSIPAALAGAALAGRVSHAWLRTALGAILLAVGLLLMSDAMW